MSLLLITGSEHACLEEANRILVSSGMAEAKPGAVYVSVTFASWHQDVINAAGNAQPNVRALGRVWEQLAVDLMLGNRKAPVWGWSGAQCLPVLDFWAEFDSDIRFVLLCEPLELAVARFIIGDDSLESLAGEIEQWRNVHEAMLRFHLRQPARAVLAWGHHAVESPGAFVQAVQEQLAVVGLQMPSADFASDGSGGLRAETSARGGVQGNELVQFLVQGMCLHHGDAVSLQAELSACIRAFGAAPSRGEDRSLARSASGRGKRSLASHLALVEGYRREKSRLLSLGVPGERKSEAHQSESEKAAIAAARDAEAKAKAEAVSRAEAVEKEKAAIAAARDAEAKAEAVSRAEAVEEEKAAIAAARDAEAKAKAEAVSRAEAVEKEKAAIAAARDAEAKAKAEAVSRAEAVEKEKVELAEENDLLLAQLHQVQEELERYYLQNQSNEVALRELQSQTGRMLGSVARAFDCQGLELLSPATDTRMRWRADKVRVVGHYADQLEFFTRIERGLLVLEIPKEGNSEQPLLRWPQSNDSQTVTLAAAKDTDGGDSWLITLNRLSTSDWDLAAGLLKTLLQRLAGGAAKIPNSDLIPYLEAVSAALNSLERTGGMLRFDAVKLTAEELTANRSVVALSLSNVSAGDVRLGTLEFQFQTHPEPSNRGDGSTLLIFGRAVAANPFKTWVGNAKGVSGSEVMAIPVSGSLGPQSLFARLGAGDQTFIRALVRSLPLCMQILASAGEKLKLPLANWLDAAKHAVSWAASAPQANPPPNLAVAARQEEDAASVPPPKSASPARKRPAGKSGGAVHKGAATRAPAKAAAKSASAPREVKPAVKAAPLRKGQPVAAKRGAKGKK